MFLTGKSALVTGSTSGIGLAIARALAGEGARVTLNGFGERGEIERLQAELGAGYSDADLTRPEAIEAMMAEAGPVDILVNNVGGRNLDVPIEDTDLHTWQSFIDLNLTHCFICTRAIGGAMLARGAGRIINIASISGLVANRGIGGRHYETAKAALIHFTRATAADWAPRGVNVNAICPGLFMTEPNRAWAEKHPEVISTFVNAVPMGRAGEPEEIGPLAVYLASPASSYVTGAAFVIDGGYTLW